jgi:NAD(P)-dependent dehydrogenase (short-subunit alcohol dehydrogenase family)
MEGSGPRIERRGEAVVIHPCFDGAPRPFESLSDADWDRAWEQPMRDVIVAMAQAHRDGARRIVVVIPTTAMSGGAVHAHVAAPAEAIRVLVKSAARQWGPDGVTVNAVAVSPERVLDHPELADPGSLAAPALAGHDDPSAVIDFLASEASGDLTGQTVTVDGGRWM